MVGYHAEVGRRRKAIAVACIALIAVTAVLPLGGVTLDWVVVPTAFVLLARLTPTGALVDARHSDPPPPPYRRTLDSRGPPSLFLV